MPPTVTKAVVNPAGFNTAATLPWSLRISDFQSAIEDIYDLLFDINTALMGRGLQRFDDMLRPAGMSGLFSDALTASTATHSRGLVQNKYHNGHPDLVVRGRYTNDSTPSGEDGVEIKATRGGGAVDMHSDRIGWLCVYRYKVDDTTEPAVNRAPTKFIEVLLAQLEAEDFRFNDRGPRGTRTTSPNAEGIAKLRDNWVYRDITPTRRASRSRA